MGHKERCEDIMKRTLSIFQMGFRNGYDDRGSYSWIHEDWPDRMWLTLKEVEDFVESEEYTNRR